MMRANRSPLAFAGLLWMSVATIPESPVAAQSSMAFVQVATAQLAQVQIRAKLGQTSSDDDRETVDGVFLPPDRTAKRRLEMAKELLEEKRYGESVRYLGSLLESSEDYFFKPDPTQGVYRSLKAEAGRLIGEMPAEGRESYELQFGARARRMLADASAAHDVNALMEVARRFFYTGAGYEATLLLGRHHLDHGRPLAAALCFQRVLDTPGAAKAFEPTLSLSLATCWLRAGMSDRAQQTLLALKKTLPGAEVQIAGKSVPMFLADAQAIPWLVANLGQISAVRVPEAGQWTLFRGDAARNAPSSGGVPLLSARWRVRTATHPALEDMIGQLRQAYLSQDIVAMPTLHPLAVGNVILMRTTRGLLAVDFATGKRIWEVKPQYDPSVEDQVRANRSQQQQFGSTTPSLLQGLDKRMWDDATYGTMSSDGQQVFVVEDLELASGYGMPNVVMFNGQRRGGQLPRETSRLAAFDLRTEGKLVWSVGGESGEDEPKLAGAFFLGPPLPLLGRLYALAEMKGHEIRLVVVSSKTGELEWSQQLAVVENNIATDHFRRAAGATPSFADGVLICPTSAGAIVAVDLTTRSLLWGYEYPRANQSATDRIQMLRMNAGIYPAGQQKTNDRWVDATATLSDGKVLVTPLETDQLYCLNLLDGKVLWKQERASNVYVACVHKGNAVLVGHRKVTAYKLADGKAAWTEPLELPSGAIPSGRGFYSGDHYYLPLSTAEVAKIDLAKGTIVQRAHSRHGDVPGNLICLRGEVISQNVDYVETYYQLDSLKADVAKTLKEMPDDAEALTRQGEIDLDEGRLDLAVKHFRRSYEIKSLDSTRDLLVEALLESLRVDFAANRGAMPELEKLIHSDKQRTDYLRRIAIGLQGAGETLPAFAAFNKLADAKPEETTPDKPNLEKLDESLSVRRDRWVQAQLTALRSAAKPDERDEIDAQVKARLALAVKDESIASLRQFLTIFGAHPAADDAREKLAALLKTSDAMLEKELLLGELRNSSDPVRARAATAQMAELQLVARQPEAAAHLYREILGKWAGVVCWNGKTGKQLVDALPADSEVSKLLAGEKPWPVGKVVVNENAGGTRTLGNNRYQRSYGLAIRGASTPFFTETTVALDQQQQSITGQDGLGIEKFRVALNEQGTRRNAVHGFNNPMLNYTSVNHHLLLLSMGHQLLAIDTLRGRETATNRVLWSQDLSEQVPGVAANQGIHPRQVNIGWGSPRYMAADAYGRPIGTMGPVGYRGVCFQRFRDLMCVHPLTGEVQWNRKGAPLGCDIIGDDELLLVVPPDGAESLVLRALDGTLLGKRRVAPVEQRMTTLGRLVLAWKPETGRPAVVLQDPWAEKDRWSFQFAPGAKAAVVADEAVAVLEPGGQFTMISLPDGKVIAKESLKLDTRALTGIYVLRSRDQYLLMTNVPPTKPEPGVSIMPAPGGLDNPLVNGQLMAFDRRTGKPAWPTPVTIEQQGLLLAQPSELPILAFARHKHITTTAGNHETKTSVLCVDKRSGQIVYKNESVPMVINNFELQGDRSDSTVTLMFPNKSINLKFTDEPVPPPAAAAPAGGAAPENKPENKQTSEKKPTKSNLAEAFGRILETFGEVLPDVVKPDANDKPRKPGTDDD